MGCNSFPEIKCITVVIPFNLVLKPNGYPLEGIKLLFVDDLVDQQIIKYHITPFQAVFGVYSGIIGGCCLEHANKCCRLLNGQVGRLIVEIGLAGGLDAISIASEIHRIEVHGQNIFLRIEHFDFNRCDPFFGFHDDHLQYRKLSK